MTGMNPSHVLVLGGSGFVGRHVCEQLVRAGYRVTVPTRRASHAACVQSLPGLTVLETPALDEATLAKLMPGHDVVINLVAVLHGNAQRFDQVHVQLPARIATAMQTAGLRRLVHVSALGADLQGPSMYQRSKARGEAVLQSAGLDLTLLRPSVIFGAEDRFLNLFADLQKFAPFMPLAGSGTRFQPVWVNDVATAIVRCLQDRHTIGQTYEACGPQTLTLGELVQHSGRWAGVNAGKGRPVLPLPRWVGWLQALAMEMAPGEPLMSRDNLASMKVDNVGTGRLPGLQALGIAPAAPSGVAPTYLGHKGPRSRLDRWRARH